MSGWCPRCDAVRAAQGACPECGTPLVAMDDTSSAPPRPAEPEAEVGAVVEGPPSARLRVALAVAAVVLLGLAFVAGRSSGRPAARAVPATAPASTTEPEPAPMAQRRLDWQARPVRGITFSALSLRRVSRGDPNGDDVGQLTIRLQGLPAGRQLLGLQGLELLDVGGGVFASPDESTVAGTQAAAVEPTGQEGTYVVALGPTPGVDTLARIRLAGIVLSQPASGRNRIELDTSGSWPARPPLRAIEPADDSVSVDISSLDLSDLPGGDINGLPLEVAGAFVGAGRAVVAFRIGSLPGAPPGQTSQVLGREAGAIPISARLLAGDRVVCERTAMLGVQGSSDGVPVVAVACPVTATPKLAVELGAGVQAAPLRATLPA